MSTYLLSLVQPYPCASESLLGPLQVAQQPLQVVQRSPRDRWQRRRGGLVAKS